MERYGKLPGFHRVNSIGTDGILARALAADSTARIFPMKDDN